MQLSNFHFELPEGLIADYPLPERTQSRLLCLDTLSGDVQHKQFTDLIDYLHPGDLLVLNDTRVIPARLHGQKATGGKVEILIERITGDKTALAHVKASKSPKPDTLIELEAGGSLSVQGRAGDLFKLACVGNDTMEALVERVGEIPLPPYIRREAETADKERYQTVYSKYKGSVAAPTAGLHFDKPLLAKLKEKGVEQACVTLHVGAGTFQSVRTNNITEHRMHSERIDVSDAVCQKIRDAKARGGRVIAVGTTSVRCLETAAKDGVIKPYEGETDIFIYPGYAFQCVDALLTNFHLPQSSLIMLVTAFGGFDAVMSAYQAAIAEKYRFFSYGDAMLLFPGVRI